LNDLVQAQAQVNIAAAVGMGGVGKTELALQYALRAGDGFAGGVCWLRGVEPIAVQMERFAQEHLGLTVPEGVEDVAGWCWQHWPGTEPVLVVVDDVQDYGPLKPLLPGNPRFRVLLTTRQGILPPGQRLELEVLTPAAALELLRVLVGAERIEAEAVQAEALGEWVGRLPLGLELVGYYLAKRPRLTVDELLQRIEAKKLAARALVQTYPEMTAPLGVTEAFELSWEPLSPEAKTVAAALGLFAAAPVEWEWVVEVLALTPLSQQEPLAERSQSQLAWEEEALEDAQVELLEVHLLQVSGTGAAARYQVHPLVREFFGAKRQALPGAGALPAGFAAVMVAIAKTIPQTVTITMRQQVEAAVPHLEEVAARWSVVLEGGG
jgi:hypothetical protein